MSSEADHAAASRIDTANAVATNGIPLNISDHESVVASHPKSDSNGSGQPAPVVKTDSGLQSADSSQQVTDATMTSPITNVAPGQAPVADFLPKEQPASHPTPPPDDEPVNADVGVDTEMSNADVAPLQSLSNPSTAGSESSLVRPREDEMDDVEPAAKRPKVNGDSEDVSMPDASSADVPDVVQPSAEATSAETDVKAEDIKPETATNGDAMETDVQKSVEAPIAGVAPSLAATDKPIYSTEPITKAQKNVLMEKMKNLKKTRNSTVFLKPVDYVLLNIPQYPEIIKHPMDLQTMESKLKSDQYASVQAFADDFDLIISNTRRFNGDAHAVTTAGFAMEAYFRNMMKSVPSTAEAVPPKASKNQSPGLSKPSAPRREPRAINVPAPAPPAPVVADTFALQPDGTPQIRRESSINRPNRAIKPPQAREIAYGKPKRKEHQPELKFCEMVLNQIVSNKFQPQNSPFLVPVDPVALNIPHYHQVIRHPMDLQTMRTKLKNGEYAKASEFKKDFDLIVSNCFLFNPVGNPVRNLGSQLQKDFEGLWAGKERFVQKRKAEAQRAASASADDESAEEDEDEEDGDDKEATIRALQQQLMDMQNMIAGLNKPSKQKKQKSSAGSKMSSKKSGLASSAIKSKGALKSKPKKPRQVTYDEKQEISSAVENLDETQLAKLTSIITDNCPKYGEMEEMELEIDELPNNVQLMLLEYVRGIFGHPKRARAASPDDIAAMDDDDFEPERGSKRGASGGKRKKHKPMGKKEQQDTIKHIQNQLAQFSNSGAGGSESPAAGGANHSGGDESSEDDASEESEEE